MNKLTDRTVQNILEKGSPSNQVKLGLHHPRLTCQDQWACFNQHGSNREILSDIIKTEPLTHDQKHRIVKYGDFEHIDGLLQHHAHDLDAKTHTAIAETGNHSQILHLMKHHGKELNPEARETISDRIISRGDQHHRKQFWDHYREHKWDNHESYES